MAHQAQRRQGQGDDRDPTSALGCRTCGRHVSGWRGISELRIHYGPRYRVYFQQRGDVLILLLCAGDKSTQDRDIRAAKQIAAQWSDDND